MLFGGQRLVPGAPAPEVLGDTWTFDAGGWHDRHPADNPPGSVDPSMAYDPVTRTVLLYETGATQSLWSWNGSDWSQRRRAQLPPNMIATPLGVDPINRHLVALAPATEDLVGGLIGWAWDGRSWSPSWAAGPPAQPGGGLVWDPRSRSELYFDYPGGTSSCPSGSCSADTTGSRESQNWLWNGTAWRRMTVTAAPHPEVWLSTDEAIGSVVAVDSGGRLWMWTGSEWVVIANQDLHATAEAVAYDPARRGLVALTAEGTWLWTGSKWRRD
ncbi:MAG TPA: hypothetical protein VE983_05455 [Solirubrobacteraceae bacterium]|nr:hypothetical protein [Solirubrobacteraceae bacterium]